MMIAVESLWPGGITRVMLLGEQAVSKAAAWGSNPHARADGPWSVVDARDRAKVADQVRLLE